MRVKIVKVDRWTFRQEHVIRKHLHRGWTLQSIQQRWGGATITFVKP